MRFVRDARNAKDSAAGGAAAIGNFDGVHLGHQAVIGVAQHAAREAGLPSGVVTFEPHPREFFAPGAPPFRLMNAEARAHRLEALGIDTLYELPFNARLAALSPEAFARVILVGGLGLRHAVVGTDFRFGKDRAGTARDLAAIGRKLGLEVTVAPLLETGGIEVSSTRIREALSDGRPEDAARMLGHLHRIEGPVLTGDRRGRELGYPTANMSIEGLHPPRLGVYAVRVLIRDEPDGTERHGVASIGVRPMFGENLPNLETHIFDYSGDLYGRHLSVALVAYLRPEERFGGVDALIRQMDADSARARAILEEAAP